MTMAARVVYGLAREGELPAIFAQVHRGTGDAAGRDRLRLRSGGSAGLVFSAEPLAESTSLATLALFALVNLSLLRLRYRGVASPNPHVSVPIWMPVAGFVTCIAMMAGALFR